MEKKKLQNNKIDGGLAMGDKSITIEYETIGVCEQRNLIEMAMGLGRAMTKEDYARVALAYKPVIDRLEEEAKKQGINI